LFGLTRLRGNIVYKIYKKKVKLRFCSTIDTNSLSQINDLIVSDSFTDWNAEDGQDNSN